MEEEESLSSSCSSILDGDLIDLRKLDLEGDQTWLLSPANSSESLNIDKWREELRHYKEDGGFEESASCSENSDGGSKQKFDSRTYTRPKKNFRPSLQAMMNSSNGMKTFTKYKHSSPMNTDTITKHHRTSDSLSEENDFEAFIEKQHHLNNDTFLLDSCDLSDDRAGFGNATYAASKPININLNEPAHNLHNTFNKYLGNAMNRHESLANMSPPSLVSSIAMDGSGAFNSATFSRQGSVSSQRGVVKNIEEQDGEQTVHNSLCASVTSSILDEKEMSTSILSQLPDNDSLIGSYPPSMANSVDVDLINYDYMSNSKLIKRRESMENSLVNSGTFNSMLDSVEEKLPNGRSKFQIRKSFLQLESDDNLDQFLTFKSNCNTDDLKGLSAELIKAQKLSMKENMMKNTPQKDDSFLLNEGLSDSFLKDTGRESLNITYNKLPKYQPLQRTLQRPTVNDFDPKPFLPNQTSSPIVSHNDESKALNRTEEKSKESPKRTSNFRKLNPGRNLTTVISDSEKKFANLIDIDSDTLDSNKKEYDEIQNDKMSSEYETFHIPSPNDHKSYPKNITTNNDRIRNSLSSDSLDRTSGSSSPARVEPVLTLDMHDLEQRAYEQQQRLFQNTSTPLSKPIRNEGNANNGYRQIVVSPIHNRKDSLSSSTSSNKSDSLSEGSQYKTIKLSRSSFGNLNASKPSQIQSPVRRDPQENAQTNRLSYYNRKPSLSQNVSPARTISNNGIRSVGGSPLKQPNLKSNELQRGLSGSNNELACRKSGLPTSKLRQYSSHKELNRIPGPTRWTGNGVSSLRPASRNSLHASNPSLYATPLIRPDVVSTQRRDFVKASNREVMGAENPYKPTNNLTNIPYGQPLKAKHNIPNMVPPPNRTSMSNVNIQANKPTNTRQSTTGVPQPQSRLPNPPAQSAASSQCLPRPSGLPRPSSGIPRKPGLRPPSTYSLAPRSTDQTSDCY